jgi:DNA ligase-1
MLFSEFASALKEIDTRSGRIEMTEVLSELLKNAGTGEISSVCYMLLGKLAPDFEGVEIGLGEKMIVRAIANSTGYSVERVTGEYRTLGDLGLVAEKLGQGRTTLLGLTGQKEGRTVGWFHTELLRVAKTSGQGAQEAKIRALSKLISDTTGAETRYLVRIVSGDMRIGIAEQTLLDALSQAYEARPDVVKRAYNITSDVGYVASVVAAEGEEGLKKVRVSPGRPLQPMLAERAKSLEEILERMGGKAAFEYKYDGERVQAHKQGSRLTLFSRRIENITPHYPDVVENLTASVHADTFIVEGEIVAVDPESGDMLPFQELMHRRRKYGIQEAKERYPARTMLFDVLYVDDTDFTERGYTERRSKLEGIVERGEYVDLSTKLVTDSLGDAQKFFDEAISSGCEGVMAKTLDPQVGYTAGSRGWAWIKYKRDYRSELTDTLDLVVVGGFYGRGKRAGKIGGYLLAAYNGKEARFETVCKVATGFTDQDLEEIPKTLSKYAIPKRHPSVVSNLEADVWYRPAVVFEIIGAEITLSPIHTAAYSVIRKEAGLAIRFPRFTGRIRDDKSPEEATSVDEIVEMYRSQLKKVE